MKGTPKIKKKKKKKEENKRLKILLKYWEIKN